MSKKCIYLIGLLISSNCLLAQSYELNPFVDLNKSICKYPDKHLTLQSSGFFEYIGAGDKKVFDCGNDTRKGDEGCKEEPELICRSENSKIILSRAESLLNTATTFVNENPKLKDKRKIQNAIKSLSENIGLWNSAKNTIDFIPSVERESIFVGSLLPNNIFQEINSKLKKTHETRREGLLAEIKRKKDEAARRAREIAQQKAAAKKAEEEKLAAEKAARSKQIKNYLIGIVVLILVLGVLSSRGRKKRREQARLAEIERKNAEAVELAKLKKFEQEELKKEKRIQAEKRKEEERIQAEIRKIELKAEKEKLDRFKKLSNDEVWSSFKDGKVCIGMHIDLVLDLKGPKYEEKRNVTRDKTTLKYKFGRYLNSRGNPAYEMEITFENDLVAAFKDF